MSEGVWRNGGFLRLWAADTASIFGTRVTVVALPMTALLTLEASAAEVGLLVFAQTLPFLLFTLPAGALVDRSARVRLLVVCDVVRAVVLASVPLAWALDVLTLSQLYAVAFLIGTGSSCFDIAFRAIMPQLVEREQLVDANSKLETTRAVSVVAGPATGGILVGVLAAPVALAVDAASYAVSAFLLRGIRGVRATAPPARRSMIRELAEGFAFVFRHPYIRPLALSAATFNFSWNVLWAIYFVFASVELGLSAATIGIILALGNAGSLAAAASCRRIADALGLGPAIVLGTALYAATLAIPLASAGTAVPYLVAAGALMHFGLVIYNVLVASLRQAITPDHLQGRAFAVTRLLTWGSMPVGSLAGSAIAAATDSRAAMWVGAVGVCLAIVPVALSPIRRLRTTPGPDEDVACDARAAQPFSLATEPPSSPHGRSRPSVRHRARGSD